MPARVANSHCICRPATDEPKLSYVSGRIRRDQFSSEVIAWREGASSENVTRHEAAATVIGRRAQGDKARRRKGCDMHATGGSCREPQVPFPGRLAGVKMGLGCPPTPTLAWDQ